jgi:hypothetical protein
MRRIAPGIRILGLLLAGIVALAEDAAPAAVPPPEGSPESDRAVTVFDMPRIQAEAQRLMLRMAQAAAAQDWSAMVATCREGLALLPEDPTWQYNLACALSRQGLAAASLDALDQAIALGFRDLDHIARDEDLDGIRGDSRYADILLAAKDLTPPAPRHQPVPGELRDGAVWVTAANTAWIPRPGFFACLFTLPDATAAPGAPVLGNGTASELIRQWHAAGTAAGNHGDLYDNRDEAHSTMRLTDFPQLTPIRYDDAAKAAGLHRGVTHAILFNHPVIGNASLAGHRSLARILQVAGAGAAFSHLQYRQNHLYAYPEHRDHDPVAAGGKGDTFPVNTPYVIVSQGSSGSDRPFLHAVAATMAAFRPEVKKALVQAGLLMPTIQMIFRRTRHGIDGRPEDYLSGKAHPTVFAEEQINAEAMAVMAQAMTIESVPPLVQIEVTEEDAVRHGIDYFDPVAAGQRLLDTPCAIARAMRSPRHDFRIVLSAEKSLDQNRRPLAYHWVILRGDPQKITIRPLDAAGTQAEIVVGHHESRPAFPGSPIDSSRVDIGVFVHNGIHFSAPGFVSFMFPANEQRIYGQDKRLLAVDYAAAADRYADAFLFPRKDWRDEYLYTPDGRPDGWRRLRHGTATTYTATGGILVARDDLGRPLSERRVTYAVDLRSESDSRLVVTETDEILWHWYASPEDTVGELLGQDDYDRRRKGD